jgi:hypothetical protein
MVNTVIETMAAVLFTELRDRDRAIAIADRYWHQFIGVEKS